jgi:transcriptional regulator with XRE-family HTH domain
MEPGRVGSGVKDLDDAVGGLIPGDNIVWVAEAGSTFPIFENALLSEGLHRGRTCVFVQTDVDSGQAHLLDPKVLIFDARPGGAYGDPRVLEEALVEVGRRHRLAHVVVNGLDALVRRWGAQRVVGFYTRTCPRLFDLDALAFWRVSKGALAASSIDQIRRVAQCVFEIGDRQLNIVKAEGRPAAVQGRVLQMSTEAGLVTLSSERALGRVSRGLQQLRRQRNLSQVDLARSAGVTPSAISQAESGRRGLSLDTLLLLGEHLGISLDALLDNRPATGYVLARRPATAESVVRLLDDPEQGLVAYLIRLGPGAEGAPPFQFKGLEFVALGSGLIQLTVGSETPVMRAGDVVLAEKDAVRGWRNMIADPALLFWILRT